MSTIMAKEDICGYCGKQNAEAVACPCRRIRFCDEVCQRAAWPEHKLVCNKQKPSKDPFRVGDVVRISGLQSAAGQAMNECLAEVYEPLNTETGRVGVMLTVSQWTIKQAAIKKENLTVELSMRDAAVQGSKLEKKVAKHEMDDIEQERYEKNCRKLAKRIPSMSGAEIVRRIREGDKDICPALVLPGAPELSVDQQDEMLNNGLASACLSAFRFPEAIDVNDKPPCPPITLVNALSNTLSGFGVVGLSGKAKFDAHRNEVCRRLGPLILLWSTKKRRLFGSTEHWWEIQKATMALISNCLMAEHTAARVLLNDLGPLVKTTLLEQVIFCLTVDPVLFLRAKSFSLKSSQTGLSLIISRKSAAQALVELADISNVGEPTVCQIGKLIVPSGALGLTGRKFAECFLDCAAHHALHAGREGQGSLNEQYEEFQYIYSCLLKSPELLPLLGDFDRSFTMVNSSSTFVRWAKQRLKNRT
jgi:hypothetical protein